MHECRLNFEQQYLRERFNEMRLFFLVVGMAICASAFQFTSFRHGVTVVDTSSRCRSVTAQLAYQPIDGDADVDEQKQLELSSAVSAGVVGFIFGGTYLSLILGAVTHHVAKKAGLWGDLVRLGLGAPPVQAVKLVAAANGKFDWSGQVSDAVGRWEVENEGVRKVVDGWQASIQYVRDVNTKYDVGGKAASAFWVVADVTDSALDAVEKVLTSSFKGV